MELKFLNSSEFTHYICEVNFLSIHLLVLEIIRLNCSRRSYFNKSYNIYCTWKSTATWRNWYKVFISRFLMVSNWLNITVKLITWWWWWWWSPEIRMDAVWAFLPNHLDIISGQQTCFTIMINIYRIINVPNQNLGFCLFFYLSQTITSNFLFCFM